MVRGFVFAGSTCSMARRFSTESPIFRAFRPKGGGGDGWGKPKRGLHQESSLEWLRATGRQEPKKPEAGRWDRNDGVSGPRRLGLGVSTSSGVDSFCQWRRDD